MKGYLLTSVAGLALAAASPALAADLPFKAPPPVVAAWSWSGFYAGAHGGYGWGHDAQTDPNDPFFGGKVRGFAGFTGFDPKGALGGIHAGYNWQARDFVFGFEGDLSFTDIKGSSFNSGSAVNAFTSNTASVTNSGAFDMLGSARGRLGYLVTPNVLLYGTGGLAWTRFVDNNDANLVSTNIPPPGFIALVGSGSVPTWRFGWVAGLGVETRLFDSNWLARLEYLHYDFGNSGSGGNLVTPFASPRSTGDLTADVIRAGISYKFDPDPFAVASAASSPSLPYKAAAITPWSWSGVYFGAHAGYGWARDPFNNVLVDDTPLFGGIDASGFAGGFQAGANWQSGRVVGGLEIDLSGSNIKGSNSNSVSGAGFVEQASQTDKIDWFGSARARLGYLVTPDVLLYGTAGPGWARMVSDQESVTTSVGFPTTTTSLVTPSWMFGWVAGLGVEARISNTNWLARFEYLHYDFGSGSSSLTIPAGGGAITAVTSGHLTTDVVQAGISYKFDGFGSGGRSAYNAMAAVPPAAPVYNWTGFYIGVNAGYGWGRDPFSEALADFIPPAQPLTLSGPNSQGFLGGFQAGANWQTRSIIGGLEIDLSGTSIKGTSSVAGLEFGTPVSQMQTDKFDWLGSGRARLGYLVTPDTLLYGTGGLAWTRLSQTTTSVNPFDTTVTTTPSWRFGWAAGAGAEMRLWNSNWLGRVEYLHYDFGNAGSTVGGLTDGVVFEYTVDTTSRHLTVDVVRAGVDYQFR